MTDPLLSIRDLSVTFRAGRDEVRAVDGVSIDVHPGETVGVVGESGSGKSVTMLSALRLLPRGAGVRTSGEVWFDGLDLLRASERELRRLRGRRIALIPQDPMTCLDPVRRVGNQLREAIAAHANQPRERQRARSVELLAAVGLAPPERRYRQYPHEYSGGMRQRAMIAMGMANTPGLLIADEPTTALDVTIQAQIVELLRDVRRESGAGLVLITHDLGLIAELADRVVVMYAGHVVESGDVYDVFAHPRHPYTRGLLDSLPQRVGPGQLLRPIPGSPPDLARVPSGCPFHPRCADGEGHAPCRGERPALVRLGERGQQAACHRAAEARLRP